MTNFSTGRRQSGTTLLEVLVTIVIVTLGLLGLASLQGQIVIAEMESYQRAQAVLLMNDMVDRINANRNNAALYTQSYLTINGTPIGTGDTLDETKSCEPEAMGVPRDLCEWSQALKGTSEIVQNTGAKTGGAAGAVGCITLIQAANTSSGVCKPGIYEVAVAWQGLNRTVAPSTACGTGKFGSDERARRAVSTQVAIGLPSCE